MRNITTSYLHYSYSMSQDNSCKHLLCLLCCTNQTPFQVPSISILTAVSNGSWDISKILCSRCCNSGVGEVGPGKQKQELWRVNCFPGFSVCLLCCVMQVAYPLCPSTASCWKDVFPVDFPVSHYFSLEKSIVKLMKNATEGCKVLSVFQGLIRMPLK